MSESQWNSEAIAYMLNTMAKTALKTRISCVFETDEQFQESMVNTRESLSKSVPKSLISAFYSSDPEKLDKPISLDALSLRSLLMLSLSHPTLKDRFTIEDKAAVAKLNDSLLRLYCIHKNVPMELADGKSKDGQKDLNTFIIDALCALGLSRNEMEERLEKKRSAEEDPQIVEDLWMSLERDTMFEFAYLKRVKEAIKLNKEGNWDEEEEKIRKIENQGSLNLDSFHNIKHTLQKTLDSFLLCGFCNKPLAKPKTLPCLHSFCSDCLKQHLNAADKTVMCQTCQTRVSAPDLNAVDVLPCTFVLTGLLVIQKAANDPENSMDCALCIQPGTQYALQTGQIFCEDHSTPIYQPEQITLIKGTDLLDKEKLSNLLQKFCPQHKLKLEQFCESCQVPLCGSSSCVTWHAQHGDLRTLEDVRDMEIGQLSRLANFLLKKEEKVNTKIQLAESNQVNVADLQENIRQSITSYFSDIQSQLEKRKEEYLRDLDKAADLCWHQDENTRNLLSGWKEKVKEVEDKISTVELANCPHSAVNTPSTTNGPTSLNAAPKTAADPPPVTNLSVLKQNHLGLLADPIGGATLAETKTLSYPEGTLRTLLQTVTNLTSNICAHSGGRGWEVVAKNTGLRYFLVNRNQLYVLKKSLFGGSQILIHDLKDFSSSPSAFLDTGGMHDFQALAINAQGHLLIPEETQNVVDFSTGIRLKKSVSIGTYTLSKERSSCMRVESLNTFNKILFKTCVDVFGKRKTAIFVGDDQCICELNADGQTVRKFDFYTMISIADFAPEPERDIIAVTDTHHSLHIFSCRQQHMVTVGSQGATPGSFSYPSGVCFDSFGHIFVADSGNSRIQVFDFNGKFLKIIPYPQSLKDIVAGPNVSPHARVVLQVHEDYLYMFDYRLDTTVYRVKYI